MKTMLQTVGVGAEAGAEKATAVNEAMRAHMLSLLREWNEQRRLWEMLCGKGDFEKARRHREGAETFQAQIVEASHIARILSKWQYDPVYSDSVRRYTALVIWRRLNEPAPGEPWDCAKLKTESFRVEV